MLENIHYPIASPNLKGHQNIEGIWLPFIWFSEQSCAKFIIQYWFKNCQVYRFEQGYLLRFPNAISGYCEQFEGWPLVKFKNQLCSMILSDNENRLMPEGDIILLMGNSIYAFYYQDSEKIDPSIWLKVDDYALLIVDEWPIEVIDLEYIDPALEIKGMDDILGDSLPKPSKALLTFVKKNQQKANDIQANKSSPSQTQRQNGGVFIIIIIVISFLILGKTTLSIIKASQAGSFNFLSYIPITGWILIIIILISLISILKRKKYMHTIVYNIYRRLGRVTITQSQAGSNASNDEKPIKEHKHQHWRDYLAKFAIVSKLYHFIQFRQSNYINSVMKMFENGNLDEALKNALPINGCSEKSQQAFSTPKPREKLSFSEKIYGVGSSIYIDYQTQQRLKQLYRHSFEKLDKENRIEEAAFVLIELLNNVNEGLDYLEKKNRWQQALDIAITKDVDPNLIVRLCCLTEQWDKAIMIAKRNNAFANAVMLLEKQDVKLADSLRLVWAKTLAERAEWLAAIDAVWPLKESRYLAKKWFEYAENTEEFNANIIVKKLILQPESINQYQEEIEQLQTDPKLYEQRLAIVSAILAHKKDINKLHSLLSALINIIISDMIKYRTPFTRADLIQLIDLTQDKALIIDFPLEEAKIKTKQKLSKSTALQSIKCSALGNRVIQDAIPLNNRNYLLALGEAGIIMVNRMGQQLKHFMIVAHQIIVSNNFNQILALAKKDGNYYCVHKIDLATENVTTLGYLRFDMSSSYFDGLNWTIATHAHIRVINVEQTLKIIWQVDLLDYQVIQMASSPTDEKWLLKNANKQYELWCYSLPAHRLTDRSDVELDVDRIILNRYANDCYYLYSKQQQTILFKQYKWLSYKPLSLTISEQQFDTLTAIAIKEFIIFIIHKENENGQLIHLYHIESNTIKMTIDWMHSNSLSCNTYEYDAIFFDSLGRCGRLDTVKNEWFYFTV